MQTDRQICKPHWETKRYDGKQTLLFERTRGG
jgi:hypothetical protein